MVRRSVARRQGDGAGRPAGRGRGQHRGGGADAGDCGHSGARGGKVPGAEGPLACGGLTRGLFIKPAQRQSDLTTKPVLVNDLLLPTAQRGQSKMPINQLGVLARQRHVLKHGASAAWVLPGCLWRIRPAPPRACSADRRARQTQRAGSPGPAESSPGWRLAPAGQRWSLCQHSARRLQRAGQGGEGAMSTLQ